jgi:hypothetical protein
MPAMRWLLVLGFGGCVFSPGTASSPQLDGGGSGVDAPKLIDGPPNMPCYGSSLEDQVCFSAVPTGIKMLPGSIDTSNAAMCSSTVVSGPTACVIAADSIMIAGVTKVTGNKPLILVAVGAITITNSGVLDVSSHSGASAIVGPGANACANPGNAGGAAGGGGGSFGGRGGNGAGDNNGNSGGTSAAPIGPTTITGGCAGGSGGGAIAGGSGGGAVALIATSISIGGTINASGAGGAGSGAGNKGGGGGGSGGMIALDATTLGGTGAVMANGAGGGGAGGGASPGNEAAVANATSRPTGGAGSSGADGGDGGAGTNVDGTNGNTASGGNFGGGGGGGAGVIRFYKSATFGGTVSPG